MENKYFIAVYTNEVKDYCDEQFFRNLYSLATGAPVNIIDNTVGLNYYNKLRASFIEQQYTNFKIHHLDVPTLPRQSQFHRNVCNSVNRLRDIYLNTDLPYFLILESDVEPPIDVLAKFENTIKELDVSAPDWGIIGGLYYHGFHNFDFDTTSTFIERTHHCLSGCTLYKRELIEKYQFRYNPEDLGPFPDAFICYDAGKEFNLWNDHSIRCSHLYNHLNGTRMSKNLQ